MFLVITQDMGQRGLTQGFVDPARALAHQLDDKNEGQFGTMGQLVKKTLGEGAVDGGGQKQGTFAARDHNMPDLRSFFPGQGHGRKAQEKKGGYDWQACEKRQFHQDRAR